MQLLELKYCATFVTPADWTEFCTKSLCVSWSNARWAMCGGLVTLLRRSIGNPQDPILFLLHDVGDLSANVGDAACLNDACNTGEGVGNSEGGLRLATTAFTSGLLLLCIEGNVRVGRFWTLYVRGDQQRCSLFLISVRVVQQTWTQIPVGPESSHMLHCTFIQLD